MKILKLKAWLKDFKEMKDIIGFKYTFDKTNITLYFDDNCENHTTYMTKDVILLQFTGLKDSIGTEIYEGDIVMMGCIGPGEIVYMDEAIPNPENTDTNVYPAFLIKWDDDSKRCSFFYKDEEIRVIGNIYKNPEILGDQE